MKKIIYIIWVAVILMIGLVFIQNQPLYLTDHSLSLNLLLFDIALPPISNGAILLFFFFSGVLLSAASGLVGRFKARKALKRCNATGDGYIDKIGMLKNQLEQKKNSMAPKAASNPPIVKNTADGDHAQASSRGTRSVGTKDARLNTKRLRADEHNYLDDITIGEMT